MQFGSIYKNEYFWYINFIYCISRCKPSFSSNKLVQCDHDFNLLFLIFSFRYFIYGWIRFHFLIANVLRVLKPLPSSLLLSPSLSLSPQSYWAALTVFHGRLFYYGDGSGVELRHVEGVATLGLGGAGVVFHFFDCNSTTGSNDVNNLMWEKDNGPLRFEVTTFHTSKRLDFSKPTDGGALDYPDAGVYTCRDVVTMESISLNISGGEWSSYLRSIRECVI